MQHEFEHGTLIRSTVWPLNLDGPLFVRLLEIRCDSCLVDWVFLDIFELALKSCVLDFRLSNDFLDLLSNNDLLNNLDRLDNILNNNDFLDHLDRLLNF